MLAQCVRPLLCLAHLVDFLYPKGGERVIIRQRLRTDYVKKGIDHGSLPPFHLVPER